jgi:hypothetical protein
MGLRQRLARLDARVLGLPHRTPRRRPRWSVLVASLAIYVALQVVIHMISTKAAVFVLLGYTVLALPATVVLMRRDRVRSDSQRTTKPG